MRKRTNTSENPWDAAQIADEDRLTENLAAPVIRYSQTRRRWITRWLKASILVFAPLIALIALGAIAPNGQPAPTATQQSSSDANSSPGKAAAIAAVQAWLAATPSPVPNGRIQSWDGYTIIPAPKLNAAQTKAGLAGSGTYEVDHFTVTAGSGTHIALFSTAVEVNTVGGVSTVIGEPTLIPQLGPSSAGGSSQVWPGWSSITPNSSVPTAVQAWATAFTSGSSDTLRIAVGDPDPNHAYLPLTGASASGVSVTASAAKPKETGAAPASPTTIIARVTMQLHWGEQATGSGTDNAALPVVTYDVLIQDASSGSPRVVAWGGSGSGPTLTPYGNSLPNTVVQNGAGGAGVAPTPAPSQGGN